MAMMQWIAEPINRDIRLLLDGLSPSEATLQFARLATEHIDDAKKQNRQRLGREPQAKTYVNGTLNAPLENVGINGVIFTEFELITDILLFISTMLDKFSPVGKERDRRPGHPGLYQRSHVLFADNVEVDITTPALVPQISAADEFVFVNTVPYARKIERGLSNQAPDGVYQAVATMARRKYSRVAKIEFTYRSIFGGERNPAIIVRTG